MTRDERVEAVACLLFRQASIFERPGVEVAGGFHFTPWDELLDIQRAPFYVRADAVLGLVESFP